MGEGLSAAIKWLSDHLSPRYLIVLAIITGFLLFSPPSVLGHFGLIPLAVTNRGIIAILFFFSGLLIVGYPVESGYRRWEARRKIRKCLGGLTRGEYRLLKRCWQNEGRATNVIADEGVAKSLEKKGILWQSSERAAQGFSITDDAYRILKEPKFDQMFDLDEIDLFGPDR